MCLRYYNHSFISLLASLCLVQVDPSEYRNRVCSQPLLVVKRNCWRGAQLGAVSWKWRREATESRGTVFWTNELLSSWSSKSSAMIHPNESQSASPDWRKQSGNSRRRLARKRLPHRSTLPFSAIALMRRQEDNLVEMEPSQDIYTNPDSTKRTTTTTRHDNGVNNGAIPICHSSDVAMPKAQIADPIVENFI